MYEEIEWLHVEPTTRCNAWCSSCGRNKNGYGLSDFVLGDLSPERLKQVINELPKLKTVQFCGTLGDPCAGKRINEQLKIIKDNDLRLQIHTNGSLRSKNWWSGIAETFKDKLEVWFAIDGLEDTHKIYRQATDWKKIIDNAEAFIDNGGNAVWQFIPFAHNEHQIKDCLKLSNKMGFKRFEFVKTARYPKISYDYQSGKAFKILPWSKHNQIWERRGKILNRYTCDVAKIKVQKKNCMHIALKSLYLNASGLITPCCYLKNTPFKAGQIEKSIQTKNYLPTCLDSCGSP